MFVSAKAVELNDNIMSSSESYSSSSPSSSPSLSSPSLSSSYSYWPLIYYITSFGIGIATIGAIAFLWRRKNKRKNHKKTDGDGDDGDSHNSKFTPILTFLPKNNGRTDQGLEWASRAMKEDEDGDWAHEFCTVDTNKIKWEK